MMVNNINRAEPLFSVIIPVYNTEAWLDRCVQSVLTQTYQNLEVVLIDDGSTDRCAKLCDEWSERDLRVRCVHQVNAGLSTTRNKGIAVAAGEYLLFLDSDDYWEQENAMEKLAQIIAEQKSDVILCGIKNYTQEGECVKAFIPEQFEGSKDEMFDQLLRNYQYISSSCVKVVRSAFLRDKQLFFEPGLRCEDVDWSGRLMLNCESIIISELVFYHRMYRNEGSLTRSVNEKTISDLLFSIKRGIKQIDLLHTELKLRKIYYQYWAYQYAMTISLAASIWDKAAIVALHAELKDYGYLLRYNANKKVALMNLVYRCAGFPGLVLVMRMWNRINGK